MAALREVRSSPVESRRTFYIGWEMHGGYYLTPIDALDEMVKPDFANEDVFAQFDDFAQGGRSYAAGEELPRERVRLVCECIGVEWSFYSGRRFLVRAAHLYEQR